MQTTEELNLLFYVKFSLAYLDWLVQPPKNVPGQRLYLYPSIKRIIINIFGDCIYKKPNTRLFTYKRKVWSNILALNHYKIRG